METVALNTQSVVSFAQPNDLDLKRIQRGLESRRRYRYVSPNVKAVDGGYRIESPCCSRNIDSDGGIIDVALLLYEPKSRSWRLFRKDHERGSWEFHSSYPRLHELLAALSADPERTFWQ